MNNLFRKYRGKNIPVIEWNFFGSKKEAESTFNEDTWSGWIPDWKPVASNVLGDAIVIYKDAFHEVQHGTGESPRAKLITKEISVLESLLSGLIQYGSSAKGNSIEALRDNINQLTQLKKQAPRPLKYDLNIEIDNIKEAIDDLKFNTSKEGKFLHTATEIQKTALAELRAKNRYSKIRLLRRANKFVFYIGGTLKRGESLEEIKSVFSKYSFAYPIEFDLNNKNDAGKRIYSYND